MVASLPGSDLSRAMTRRGIRCVTIAVLVLASACGESHDVVNVATQPTVTTQEPCAQRNPLRNVYFGDLHVHTTYSFDATPSTCAPPRRRRIASRRAAPVSLPPLDANGNGTRTVQLERPLDFTAVTDHSEFLGEVETCTTPGSPTYDSTDVSAATAPAATQVTHLGSRSRTAASPRAHRATSAAPDGARMLATRAGDVWRAHAGRGRRGLRSSAAATSPRSSAYEYSRRPAAQHDASQRHLPQRPRALSHHRSSSSRHRKGCGRELKPRCIDAGIGCDVLAIPHNSNESNGQMFFVEYPGAHDLDRRAGAGATARIAWSRWSRSISTRASSECFNGLSGIVGAPDEQCEFETPHQRARRSTAATAPASSARADGGLHVAARLRARRAARRLAGGGAPRRQPVPPRHRSRSTDTHNGTPGSPTSGRFMGHQGANDATAGRCSGTGTSTPVASSSVPAA